MKFKMVKLNELCEINIGKTPSRSNKLYWGEGKDWIAIADINSKYISGTKEQITEQAIKESNMKEIPTNTVIMSFKLSIGKISITKKPMFSNEAIASFQIKNGKEILPEYIYYALKTVNLISYGDKAVKGITLNKKKLNEILIPYTDLNSQKRIIEVLCLTEELIQKRQSQIAALDELTQSVFIEMFGDPVTNSKKWPIKKLGEIGILNRGISKHRPRNAPELLGGPYPLIQTGDVAKSGLFIRDYKSTYSEIGLQQSKMWQSGTLCITIAANIAKTGILKFEACFPDSVVGYTAGDSTNNIFIHYWFGFFQQILESSAPESAQKNINLKILNNMDVIVPPLELQNEFKDFVLQIEKQKDILYSSLYFMNNLYQSILQKAFRGKLFEEKLVELTH